MFVSGQSQVVGMIFSALTFSVAIPSAIKVFNWLATMYKGSIGLAPPMCFALAFIFLFGIGGLTGLFLGSLATDVHVHDTAFVVAHFHYTMAGGVLMAFLAGLHYWWPKIAGRMYGLVLGQITALVILVGFNLTYFPQFIIGSRGMPRRYFDYTRLLEVNPEFTFYQIISTVGRYLFVGGLVLVGINLVRPLPSERLTARQVATFAALSSAVGVVYLAALATLVVTLLAALSWIIYVLVYTPLKRVSVWQTPVGAVAGAIPVLSGAATAGSLLTLVALVLFGVVFFWQFPHTVAIGWVYRRQYAAGAVKVAAVVDPSGRLAGRLALCSAACLLLASLVPLAFSMVAWTYGTMAGALGLAHLVLAARFFRSCDDAAARSLWWTSLNYLPVLLAALLVVVRL